MCAGEKGGVRAPRNELATLARQWSEMDIDDLKAAIEHGSSIEEAAQFLCRADSVELALPILGPVLKAGCA